jgi:hypothetical protein
MRKRRIVIGTAEVLVGLALLQAAGGWRVFDDLSQMALAAMILIALGFSRALEGAFFG